MTDETKKWLKSQHEWMQEAVFRILTTGTTTNQDILDFVNIIKTTQASAKRKAANRVYPDFGAATTSSETLRLVAIDEISGIDRLAPRKPLKFADGNISLIYGQNGSGKSGYTRILKKITGKAEAAPLRPNVFADSPADRYCHITYSINGNNTRLKWLANSGAIRDLKAIDIFDSSTGRIYIEKETTVAYKPAELVLMSELVEVCKKVDELLVQEQNALTKSLPILPSKYATTEVGRQFESLRAITSSEEEASLKNWEPTDEERQKKLSEKLSTANPAAEAVKQRSIKTQIDTLKSNLKGALLKVTAEEIQNLKDLRNKAQEMRRIATEGSAALTTSAKLEGLSEGTWRALWDSARQYSTSKAYPEKDFPYIAEGARCVLCHQELDSDAKKRLSDFDAFVSGTLETAAQAAEKAVADKIENLPEALTDEEMKTAALAANLSEQASKDLASAWKDISAVAKLMEAVGENDIKKGLEIKNYSILTEFDSLSAEIEKKAIQFESDAKEFDRSEAEAEILELEAKLWVSQQADAIVAEIARLKEIDKISEWRKLVLTNGPTRHASKISETLITEEFVRRFNAELAALGAGHISVEMVKTGGAHGEVKHQVQLKGLKSIGAKAGEILSEGENRIVSLAAFLADVGAKTANAPFIFDDPISSLDQIYEEKTIERLVELSKERQVLIFTHRLSFVSILSDIVNSQDICIHIGRESWGTGEPGEIPLFGKKPESALNALKGERLPQAKKVLEANGRELYYPLAKAICSDFRILMERVVELVLLADVVQRHRRAVTTMNKIENLAKINLADCQLIDQMMTKYSRFEHSQSYEAPVEVPEPDELLHDIGTVLSWHTEFKNRKVT